MSLLGSNMTPQPGARVLILCDLALKLITEFNAQPLGKLGLETSLKGFNNLSEGIALGKIPVVACPERAPQAFTNVEEVLYDQLQISSWIRIM